MQLGIQASLGATATSGVESATLVTNTKSIAFDGSDDRILIADHASLSFGDAYNDSAMSWSFWIKLPSGDTADHPLIVKDGSSTMEYSIMINSSSQILFRVHDNSLEAYRGRSGGTALSADTWYHILCTYDGTGGTDAEDGMEIYLNGVAETLTDFNAGTYVAMHNTSDPLYIGFTDRISDISAAANIDEVALWNKELTATEAKAIYDNVRLDFTKDSVGYASSSNLAGWWRMGDEADTRVLDTSADNLIIPDMRKTFFTGKSIDFDGGDDYIAANSVASTITDFPFTMSAWANLESSGSGESIVSFSDVSDTDVILQIAITSGADKIQLFAKENGGSSQTITASSAISAGVWVHIVGVFASATSRKLYINGAQEGSEDTNSVAFDSDDIDTFTIGGLLRSGITRNFGGKVTDVGIWNAELDDNTISSIYNSGEPNDLTLAVSYTAGSGVDKTGDLQAYWRMGNGTLDAFASYDDFGLIADQTNATLGSNLFDSDFANATADGTYSGTTSPSQGGTHVGETYGWVSYSNATVTNEGGNYLFESTSANNAVTEWLRDSYDLSAEINDGAIYEFSLDIKVNTASVNIANRNNVSAYVNTISDTTYTTYKFYWKSNTAIGSNYMQITDIDPGQEVRVKNFSLKKVQGNPGLMTNMKFM
mgnify:CR=1 FL=1